MTARALDSGEMAAFRLARLRAAEAAPYFMAALFAVTPLADPGLGTFAVDAHWRLYMDPALLTGADAWPPAEAGGVLVHEVGHLIRDHAGRRAALPFPQHALAWNLAGDAEVNDDLVGRVPLPAGVITPGALGLEDHGLAEDYYRSILDPAAGIDPDGCDDGGPGCGPGAGGPALPGELPGSGPAPGQAGTAGLSAADADMVRRRVAEAVQAAASGGGRGTLPAGLDRWASGVLAPPVISWARVLRASVRVAIANQAGRTNYTYQRPSRRQVPGFVMPAMRGPAVPVTVVVDTSGSMNADALGAALSEIAGVLRSTGVARDKVRVLCCDAEATAPRPVRSVRDVRLTGGGGTDMRVGISAAAQARPAPAVIIVLSDGYTPWPDRPGRARLVCGIISPLPPDATPEWATTVHIPAAA